MKILVIGSGAREHTIAWKLAQSPKVDEMFAAPGNAGTAAIARNVAIRDTDIDALLKFAGENRIDLTVVGPEAPLAAGIVDSFTARGLAIFGPTQQAAEIESSKVFAKELMQRHGIPTARSASFADFEQALEYIKTRKTPFWIKADGLAAGKGVILAESVDAAGQILASVMKDKKFGASGDRVVIEENLAGREMSFFVFTDGHNVLPTVPACDYKRIYDGNEGPNTGGMGSFSPPPFSNRLLEKIIMETVMQPVVLAMADEGRPYRGVLYGGLMLTHNSPRVVEFNARLGDPETQVVLPRLKTDLLEIMLAVVENRLDTVSVEWSEEACVGVVMASGGYPGRYNTGYPVSGLDELDPDIMVFHAGTRLDPEGRIITGGGRVLTVTALGSDLAEARRKVYNNISKISFKDSYYRRDIADLSLQIAR